LPTIVTSTAGPAAGASTDDGPATTSTNPRAAPTPDGIDLVSTTIYVRNDAYEDKIVEIELLIDGASVGRRIVGVGPFTGDATVELALPPGVHELTAQSMGLEDALSIQLSADRNWIVVTWLNSRDGMTLVQYPEQPQFA
jgi:hypothetical protein